MTADIPWWDFFHGLWLPIQILFWIVLFIGTSSVFSASVLAINAARQRHRTQRLSALQPARESDYLWVFIIAALNEEITIADTVGWLRATEASNRLILVINDGSDDATAEVLASIHDPDLHVLTRVLPNARQGKGAALNNAHRYLRTGVLPKSRYSRWSPDQVIVGVIDADGRLDPHAPEAVAHHFSSDEIGGVQTLVRIYNQSGYLTWAQNVEFAIVGKLFQSGRSWWGTANMGGNGQFNRLSALTDVADDDGPWRDRLTEDQDLGVRLIQKGWRCAQENSVTINQQGLSHLGRLYRQRTRWAQGAWEALPLIRGVPKAGASLSASIDLVYYLLTPVLQLVTGIAFLTAIIVSLTRDVAFVPESIPVLIYFASIGLLPGLIGLLHRQSGARGVIFSVLLSVPYLVYSWLLFPVVVWSLLRHLFGAKKWSKTARQ